MILLTEYHASSIRLWRVILLRSDIRLTPSVIRFASFRANRISLWGVAEQYHCPQGQYHSLRKQRISLIDSRKRESLTEFCFRITLPSVLSPVSHLFYKCIGLRPYPYLISPIRTSHICGFPLFFPKEKIHPFRAAATCRRAVPSALARMHLQSYLHVFLPKNTC